MGVDSEPACKTPANTSIFEYGTCRIYIPSGRDVNGFMHQDRGLGGWGTSLVTSRNGGVLVVMENS